MSASLRGEVESWVGLALCGAVTAGWVLEGLVPNVDAGQPLGPDWLPFVAAVLAAAAILTRDGRPGWQHARSALRWTALLLLVWAANGLPFDLLTMAGLIGHRSPSGDIVLSTVYWPGLVTRAFALGGALVLARLALRRPVAAPAPRPATWYGYVAFVLALPYPALRLHWAMGGTLGLGWPGAAGEGWEPLLIAIPWMLAAGLSLLLVGPPSWIPRPLLLAAGWSATLVVAMIGPAALWTLISDLAAGGAGNPAGIAWWVFALFYASWFLWAIAAGAATRSYQLRSPSPPAVSVTLA